MKKIKWINIYKCIGIILMVIGHTSISREFDVFIHAFHMPMFFVISGYLFKKDTVKNTVKRKAKTLLLPYIIFGLFNYIFSFLIYKQISIEPLKRLLFVNTDGLPIAGALWFLTSLFVCCVVYTIIGKICKSNSLKSSILVSILVLVAIYYNKFINIEIPYGIIQGLVGMGFYHVGHLIKTNEKNKIINKLVNLNLIQTLLLGVVCYYFIFKNDYINMRLEIYSSLILFFLNAIFSSICIINIAKAIEKIIGKFKICEIVELFGKDSIVIVCLNQLVILLTTMIVQKFNFFNQNLKLENVIIVVITLIVLYIITYFTSKTNLSLLYGKKSR